MKKLILFILTFAYLASSSGATIFVQQCMGKTISWSFCEKAPDKCSKCGMQKNAPNSCCNGHVKVLKVHNDQNVPENFFNKISLTVSFLPAKIYAAQKLYTPSISLKHISAHRPPPSNGYRVLYCSFLI